MSRLVSVPSQLPTQQLPGAPEEMKMAGHEADDSSPQKLLSICLPVAVVS